MFYVYGLIDSITGQCFYVGKGTGDRMYRHVQKVKRGDTTSNPHLDHKIAKLLREGVEVQYIKFHDNLADEDEAYRLEEAKTRELGLDTLCNAWHGGKGGRIPSTETRRKISENRKGVPMSAEHKEKLRQAHLGKKASQETIKKQSDALKGKPQTAAQRAANASRSASHKGRAFSEEHKQKLRDAKMKNPVRYWQGKQLSEEHKDKIRATAKTTLENKEDDQQNG